MGKTKPRPRVARQAILGTKNHETYTKKERDVLLAALELNREYEGKKLLEELKDCDSYTSRERAFLIATLQLKQEYEDKVTLAKIPTYLLVEELKKREGVETTIAEPYEDVNVSVNGPAIILKVFD